MRDTSLRILLAWATTALLASLAACGSVENPGVDAGPQCGNTVLEAGEDCEDGNTVGGDGCSATCQTESCDNNRMDEGEDCDGSDLGGQTCTSLGLAGTGLTCTSGCTLDTSACEGCGNGIVETGEICDDGDVESNDGCDDACSVESAWECDGASPSSCNLLCGNLTCASGETSGSCPNDCGPRWLASGSYHSCTLLGDGTARCWGWNGEGQLGNSSATLAFNAPVQVTGLDNGTAIHGGLNHSCVLLATGAVRCWGDNGEGQLGVSGVATSNAPVNVPSVANAVGITLGGNHSCAWMMDGSAKCWGWNGHSQLGTGDGEPASGAVGVVGLSAKVEQMAAGAQHTCALLDNGKIECWGNNLFAGQLGDGSQDNSADPVPVGGVTTAVAIAARDFHTCALLADESVVCWGYNNRGQLGNGGTDAFYPDATAVSNLSTFISIGAGGQHSCGVLSDGTALLG